MVAVSALSQRICTSSFGIIQWRRRSTNTLEKWRLQIRFYLSHTPPVTKASQVHTVRLKISFSSVVYKYLQGISAGRRTPSISRIKQRFCWIWASRYDWHCHAEKQFDCILERGISFTEILMMIFVTWLVFTHTGSRIRVFSTGRLSHHRPHLRSRAAKRNLLYSVRCNSTILSNAWKR